MEHFLFPGHFSVQAFFLTLNMPGFLEFSTAGVGGEDSSPPV